MKSKNTITYAVALITIIIAALALQGWWLQSIIEHFKATPISFWFCVLIMIVADVLSPKALRGLPMLILFGIQCYIWIA